MQITCPCCGADEFGIATSREKIAWESSLRKLFAERRTKGARKDAKDRTIFTHDEAVDLFICPSCGLLVRGDFEKDFTTKYAVEPYDREVLEHFLKRDIRFFYQKEKTYASLLPPGSKIIELGSYAGGFLHVAASWGWQATGLDIGADIARFANENGYETRRQSLTESNFPPNSLDGVFIWNCFEQLPEPNGTLSETFRILKPNGLLVLRTPSALFYRFCQPLLHELYQKPRGEVLDLPIVKAMGYNNLLGFPYQFGYTPSILRRMAERYRFVIDRLIPSHLNLLPEDDAPDWAVREQHETATLLEELNVSITSIHRDLVASPWLEAILRKPAS